MDCRLRNNHDAAPKCTGKRKKLIRMSKESSRNLSKCSSCEEVQCKCNTRMLSIDASSKNTCSPAVDNNFEDSIGRRLSRRRGSTLLEKSISLIKEDGSPLRKSEEEKSCIKSGIPLSTPMKENPEEDNLMSSETDLSVSEDTVNKESSCSQRRMRKKTSVGSANNEDTKCTTTTTSSSIISPYKRTTRLSAKVKQISSPEIVGIVPIEKIAPIIAAPRITRGRTKKKCDMFDKFNDDEHPVQTEEVTCTSKLPKENTCTSSAFDKNICSRNSISSDAEDDPMVFSAETVQAIGIKPLPQERCNDSEKGNPNLQPMNSKVELGDHKISSLGRYSEKNDSSYQETTDLKLRKTLNLSKAHKSLRKQNETASPRIDKNMTMLSVADKVVKVEINSALTASQSTQTNTDLSLSAIESWEIQNTSAPMVACATQTKKASCKNKGLQTTVGMTSMASQISSGEFSIHKETNTDLKTEEKNVETIFDLMTLLREQLRSENISKRQGSFPKKSSKSSHDSKLTLKNNETHDQNSSQQHRNITSNETVSKKSKKSSQINKVQVSSFQKVEEKSSLPVFQRECAVLINAIKMDTPAPVIGSESKSKLDQKVMQGDKSTTLKPPGSSRLLHSASKSKCQKPTILKDMGVVKGIDSSQTSGKKDFRKSVMSKVVGESKYPSENATLTNKDNAKDCDSDVNLEFANDGKNLKNSSKTTESDEKIISNNSNSSESKKSVHPLRRKRTSSSEKWEGSIKRHERSKGPTVKSTKSPITVSVQDLKTEWHSSKVNSDNSVNVGGVSGSDQDSSRLNKSSKEKHPSDKCTNKNSVKSEGIPKSSISLGGFRNKKIEESLDHTHLCVSDNGSPAHKSSKINTDNYSQSKISRNVEGKLDEVKNGLEDKFQQPPDIPIEAAEIKIEVEDQYYYKDDDDIISIYGECEFDDLFDCLDGHQSSLFDYSQTKKNAQANDNQFMLSGNHKERVDENSMIKRQECIGNSMEGLTGDGGIKRVIDDSNNDMDVSEGKGDAVKGINIDDNFRRSCLRDDSGIQNEVKLSSKNSMKADVDVNYSESEKESEKVQLDSSKKIVMANLVEEKSINEIPQESESVQLEDTPKKMLKANLIEKKSVYEIPKVSVTGSDILIKNFEKGQHFGDEAEPKAEMSKQKRITGKMHLEDREEISVTGRDRGNLQSTNYIQPPRNIPSLGLDLNIIQPDWVCRIPPVLKGLCFKYLKDYCNCGKFSHKYPPNFLQKIEALNSWDIYCILRFAIYRYFKKFLSEMGAKLAGILVQRKEANLFVDFVMEYSKKMAPSFHFWKSVLKCIVDCEIYNEISVCDILKFIVRDVLVKQTIPGSIYLAMVDMIIVKSCSFKNSHLSCEVLCCLANDRFWLQESTIEVSLKRCFTIISGPDRNAFCPVIGQILSNANFNVPLLDNTMNLYSQLVYHLKKNGHAVLAETLKKKSGKIENSTQLYADPGKPILTVSSGDVKCEEFAKSFEKSKGSSIAQRLEPQDSTHIHLKRRLEDVMITDVLLKKARMSSDQSEKYKSVNSCVSSNHPVELQPYKIQSNTEIQSSFSSKPTNHSNSYLPHGSSSSSQSSSEGVEDKTAGDQADVNTKICSPIYPIPTVMSCQVQADQKRHLFYDKNASAKIWSGSDSCLKTPLPSFKAPNFTEDSLCSKSQNIEQISVNLNSAIPKRDINVGFHHNLMSNSVRKSNSAGNRFCSAVEEQTSRGKFISSDIVIQIPLQDNLAMGTSSVQPNVSSKSSKCEIDQTQLKQTVSRCGSSEASVSDLNENSAVMLSEKPLKEALNEKDWTAAKMLSTFGPWLTSSELEKELAEKLCEILEQDFASAVPSIQSWVNCMGTQDFIRLNQSGKIKGLLKTVLFNLILKMVISDVWVEAYQLLTVAKSAKLSILFSEAFIDEEISISRKILVFSEICFRVQEMDEAIDYLNKGNLFAASTSDWKYDSLEGDKEIQVTLLSSLMLRLATGGYSEAAPNTFLKIYNSQKTLTEPIELLAHANKVIVCALNGNAICPAYEVYSTLLRDLAILPKPTHRAIIIGLVLNKRISAAREVLKKVGHLEIYPSYTEGEIPCEILIHSYWQKEEIFIILDSALRILCEAEYGKTDFNMNLLIKVSVVPEDMDVSWSLLKEDTGEEGLDPIPHSLALTSNKLEDIHERVVFVLQKMLLPPIQFDFVVIEEGLEGLFTLHPYVLVNHLFSRHRGGKGYWE